MFFFILPNPKFRVNDIWYARRPDISRYKLHSRAREIWYVGKHTSLTYPGIHCTLGLSMYALNSMGKNIRYVIKPNLVAYLGIHCNIGSGKYGM